MKPTHIATTLSRPAEVTAWQFNHTLPIPVWVARKFHRVDDTGWHGIARDGSIVKAEPSNWAVVVEGKDIIVLTHEEFTSNFRPI